MSDDTVRQIQSLIDAKKGDAIRLQQMLDTLQQGNALDISDQNYLQEISAEPQKHTDEDSTITPDLPEYETSESLDSLETAPKEEEAGEALDEDAVIRDTRNAPSRKKIAIVAAVIVAIVVAYVGLDSYAVSTLQFRPNTSNEYQISPTEIHIQADVCNPSFFPTSFNKYEITAFYNSSVIEKADIGGTTLSSKAMSTVDGVFVLNTDVVLKLKQENATFDP
ncbi:MAG: hypothetical protein KGH83_07390, partial [Thaumarchaeota archaeon]|nr:hypothetical protein [Nitrososphaerota archaeon]